MAQVHRIVQVEEDINVRGPHKVLGHHILRGRDRNGDRIPAEATKHARDRTHAETEHHRRLISRYDVE